MVFETLTIPIILAIVGLVLGFMAFKLNPIVGFGVGSAVLLVLISIVLTTIFGNAGFVDTLRNNAFMQGLTVFSAGIIVGDVVGGFTSK